MRGPLEEYLASGRQWAILIVPLLSILFLGISAAVIQWGARQILQVEGSFNRVIFTLAAINEVVWRTQTYAFWANFKVVGIMPLTILFALSQTPLLMRYDRKAEAKPDV